MEYSLNYLAHVQIFFSNFNIAFKKSTLTFRLCMLTSTALILSLIKMNIQDSNSLTSLSHIPTAFFTFNFVLDKEWTPKFKNHSLFVILYLEERRINIIFNQSKFCPSHVSTFFSNYISVSQIGEKWQNTIPLKYSGILIYHLF